ncbi:MULTISPECIES: hypothetical protein [Marinobacter]|uniref:hypothetical protein n=1 Tax=Marinobacter TaxID=2742 RepID=UPI001E38ACEF|nr:hypothetical protein [Marinobacter shengliensis]MCD1631560.1 hypothetical protein [Marinobacter shengliensis]
MDFYAFLIATSATVAGGAILALVIFIIKEIICPIPNINGRWYFQKTTLKTAYNPYKNMVLRYEVMLWVEGATVRGSAEKFYEDAQNRTREYVGEHRTRAKVGGFIQKNYLRKDRVFIHIIENGESRESTTFHELKFNTKKKMQGQFYSMVAKQSGEVQWQRTPF